MPKCAVIENTYKSSTLISALGSQSQISEFEAGLVWRVGSGTAMAAQTDSV